MKEKTLPRGLRNNNPLNIERTTDKWQGMADEQPDPRFATFRSTAWGYRAALVILRNYRKRYGLTTLRELITRWAPPGENNTRAYLDTVARRSKLRPDLPVDLHNPDTVVRLLEAMAYVENGVTVDTRPIREGYRLLR